MDNTLGGRRLMSLGLTGVVLGLMVAMYATGLLG